jgi:ribonuclease VapC
VKVIDTSALIAAVMSERGAATAEAAMVGGSISHVNVAESIAILIRKGFTFDDALALVVDTRLTWHATTTTHAYEAARIVQMPGLSLGDSFCIALAKSLKTSAVTADRMWAELNLDVAVELIR